MTVIRYTLLSCVCLLWNACIACSDIPAWQAVDFIQGNNVTCDDSFSRDDGDWFGRCETSCKFTVDPSTGHTACTACCDCGGGQIEDRKELATNYGGIDRSIRFGYGYMFTVRAKDDPIRIHNIGLSFYGLFASASMSVWTRSGKIDPIQTESSDDWTIICDSCRFNILDSGWRGLPEEGDIIPTDISANTEASFYFWTGNWESLKVDDQDEFTGDDVIRENDDIAIVAGCITETTPNTPPSQNPYFDVTKVCNKNEYWMGSVLYAILGPSSSPSDGPTSLPTPAISLKPTTSFSLSPTPRPSVMPISAEPSILPTEIESRSPSKLVVSSVLSGYPSQLPSSIPSRYPSQLPSSTPSLAFTSYFPSASPSSIPSKGTAASAMPSIKPSIPDTTITPTTASLAPSMVPISAAPSLSTASSTVSPSQLPHVTGNTVGPSLQPTILEQSTTITPTSSTSNYQHSMILLAAAMLTPLLLLCLYC